MQRYVVDTNLDGKVMVFGKGGEPVDLSPGDSYYDASEADAELAAKDALIARLLGTLRVIAKNTDPDDPESYRCDDREGCLDDTHAAAVMAIAAVNKIQPHPDTARLDKLPQCFHMLRYTPLPDGQWWHLTYATNKIYRTVREAIDAHKGEINGAV